MKRWQLQAKQMQIKISFFPIKILEEIYFLSNPPVPWVYDFLNVHLS